MVLLPDEVDLFVVKVVFEALVRHFMVVAGVVVCEGVLLVVELMGMCLEVGNQILVINMRLK